VRRAAQPVRDEAPSPELDGAGPGPSSDGRKSGTARQESRRLEQKEGVPGPAEKADSSDDDNAVRSGHSTRGTGRGPMENLGLDRPAASEALRGHRVLPFLPPSARDRGLRPP